MPKEKKRTGKYCVAAGCTATNADDISLHEFPKEVKRELRRKWINFVKTKRQDFTQPTRFSVLCERHFAPNCYPEEYRIKQSLGIVIKKKRLLPDAVPTIHLHSSSTPTNSDAPIHDSKMDVTHVPNKGEPAAESTPFRGAFRKREYLRVFHRITF
ncbi:THAP domain-containing protein 10-like [Saccostrea cucullata]|uniref:THAP domain-containing protein 10-like n=1 Tax=Saccostrea cuccullata TaxID=36930 RepID=UPI002ED07EEF